MTMTHGRGAAASVDGVSLAAYSNSITFTRTAEVADCTPYGARSKKYRRGLPSGTASIEGIYDSAAVGSPGRVLRPLVGAPAVDLIYCPEGAGFGNPSATVDVFVTSYEESTPVADMITWSAEFQLSGDIHDTAQPPSSEGTGYGDGGYGINGYGD